jgi:probable addiction module antidote protein
MTRSRKFSDFLNEHLQDPERALGYMNQVLSEVSSDDKISQKAFLTALKDIINAKGGIGELAKRSNLNRESLYKTLQGNPRLSTLITLLKAVGLELKVAYSEKKTSITAVAFCPVGACLC